MMFEVTVSSKLVSGGNAEGGAVRQKQRRLLVVDTAFVARIGTSCTVAVHK